jgi:hypothetical protein
VTSLVIRRVQPNRWLRWAIGGSGALVLLVLAQFFGPITLVGWREANQYDFTPNAAYWRARDAVRNGGLPSGALVEFHDFAAAKVDMHAPDRATIRLRGDLSGGGGSQPAAWEVAMKFDPAAREWSRLSVREIPPAP